ncbi:MAG: hypothetical protein PHR69_03780, partial [Sphaerochaeta sp.]|nr:hypothetical protein [Sphaerochaeta sp.]
VKKVVCMVIPTVMTTTERTIARMVFLSISAPDGVIHEKKSQERLGLYEGFYKKGEVGLQKYLKAKGKPQPFHKEI